MRIVPVKRPVAIAAGGLALLLASGVVGATEFLTGGPDPRFPTPRHIRYGLTIENPTSAVIPTADLWIYAPVKQTSTQKCLRVQTSRPAELVVDALGNQVLHFRLQDLPPHGSRTLTVSADLAMAKVPQAQVLPGEELDAYLAPEPLMESDHPAILKLAGELAGDSAGGIAEAAYRWVSERIRYAGYLKDDRGALYALEHGEGDCTESMALFVALVRAGGVPARGVAGYVYDRNAVVDPNDFHNWAEFRRDGKWLLADPQNKVFAGREADYIAFRVIGLPDDGPMGGAHRFRISDERLDVLMN